MKNMTPVLLALAVGGALLLASTPGFATEVPLGCEYVSGTEGDVTFARYIIKNTTNQTIPNHAKIKYTTNNPQAVPATWLTPEPEPPGTKFGPSNTDAVKPGTTCSAKWIKP